MRFGLFRTVGATTIDGRSTMMGGKIDARCRRQQQQERQRTTTTSQVRRQVDGDHDGASMIDGRVGDRGWRMGIDCRLPMHALADVHVAAV